MSHARASNGVYLSKNAEMQSNHFKHYKTITTSEVWNGCWGQFRGIIVKYLSLFCSNLRRVCHVLSSTLSIYDDATKLHIMQAGKLIKRRRELHQACRVLASLFKMVIWLNHCGWLLLPGLRGGLSCLGWLFYEKQFTCFSHGDKVFKNGGAQWFDPLFIVSSVEKRLFILPCKATSCLQCRGINIIPYKFGSNWKRHAGRIIIGDAFAV